MCWSKMTSNWHFQWNGPESSSSNSLLWSRHCESLKGDVFSKHWCICLVADCCAFFNEKESHYVNVNITRSFVWGRWASCFIVWLIWTQFGEHHPACGWNGGCENTESTNRSLFYVWEKGSLDTFSAKASAVSLQERSIWNCISNISNSLSSWEDAETEEQRNTVYPLRMIDKRVFLENDNSKRFPTFPHHWQFFIGIVSLFLQNLTLLNALYDK